jgi:hypothetical protein
VQYVEDTTINDDMLSCKPIKRRATATETITQIVDDFMKEKKIIKWSDCAGVCTDGALVMAECKGVRP